MDNDLALSFGSVVLDLENLGSDSLRYMNGKSDVNPVLIDAYKFII
jgi:hypothetical protein